MLGAIHNLCHTTPQQRLALTPSYSFKNREIKAKDVCVLKFSGQTPEEKLFSSLTQSDTACLKISEAQFIELKHFILKGIGLIKSKDYETAANFLLSAENFEKTGIKAYVIKEEWKHPINKLQIDEFIAHCIAPCFNIETKTRFPILYKPTFSNELEPDVSQQLNFSLAYFALEEWLHSLQNTSGQLIHNQKIMNFDNDNPFTIFDNEFQQLECDIPETLIKCQVPLPIDILDREFYERDYLKNNANIIWSDKAMLNTTIVSLEHGMQYPGLEQILSDLPLYQEITIGRKTEDVALYTPPSQLLKILVPSAAICVNVPVFSIKKVDDTTYLVKNLTNSETFLKSGQKLIINEATKIRLP